MLARGRLTLMHIRGIRIAVDYSWFLVLFLIIWWLSDAYREQLGEGQSDYEPYLLAVASAVLFFGSILLHELGHAAVANRRGIPITEITLWMFGGVARMTKDSDSPGTEFKIAAAGPAVTLLLVIVSARPSGSRSRARGEFWDAITVEAGRRDLRRAGDARLAGLDQRPACCLQPDPGLPPRRRPDHARDRLAADRRSQPRDALRRHPRARLLLPADRPRPAPRDRLGDIVCRGLAGADRLHPRPVGARVRAAVGVLEPDRGHPGCRRDGRRAGRDPRGDERRARPGRVLPALPLALVPGRRRRATASAA